MRVLGELCLLLAFVGSGYSAFASLMSRRWARLQRASVFVAMATFVALTGTLAVLCWALLVKDFHFASMREKIEPAVFYYRPDSYGRLYVKTNGRDAPKAIAALEKVWKKYNADFPFNYTFLDEAFNNLYKSDQRQGLLFNIFAAIAILISCLGLFGLAAYTAQVRTREIGVRKVLGASVAGIIRLLAVDFIRLVFIAIVIAVPVAWYVMNKWLQDFAYKVNIGWTVFFIAGVSAVLIAILTISFQSIKAALANPVKSLRTE